MQIPAAPESPTIAVDHHHMVERIIDVMRTAIDPLALDELAEIAGLSPFYFVRTFRAIAGIPPGEFQAALRFERAKHLLLTTDTSVTEICFEVGYDSLGTFSSRFKRLVGVGPAQFRALPHMVVNADVDTLIEQNFAGPGDVHAVCGHISATGLPQAHIYVGLFHDPIAATRPVTGMILPGPGMFALPPVPSGSYYLLAAALPTGVDPYLNLLPGEGVKVASAGPLRLRPGQPPIEQSLALRPLAPTDPPLLTALPALLLRKEPCKYRRATAMMRTG